MNEENPTINQEKTLVILCCLDEIFEDIDIYFCKNILLSLFKCCVLFWNWWKTSKITRSLWNNDEFRRYYQKVLWILLLNVYLCIRLQIHICFAFTSWLLLLHLRYSILWSTIQYCISNANQIIIFLISKFPIHLDSHFLLDLTVSFQTKPRSYERVYFFFFKYWMR